MPQGDKARNDQISKNGHKGQICDGTISINLCHEEYYLCGKFYAFVKKGITIFVLCCCNGTKLC